MLVNVVLGLTLCGVNGCEMQIADSWDQVDQITAVADCQQEKQKYVTSGNDAACYFTSTNDHGDIVIRNVETGVFSIIKK